MPHKKKQKSKKKGMPPGTLIYTGDRPVKPSQITNLWYNAQSLENAEALQPYKNGEIGVQWIDIRNIADATLIEQLGTAFLIHTLAQEDILNTTQRPKIDQYEHGTLTILHNLEFIPASIELKTEQIALFATPTAVLSFQEDEDDTFGPIRLRIQEGRFRIRRNGADYLNYTLIDAVVDNYYSVLDGVEDTMNDLETAIYQNNNSVDIKGKTHDLKQLLGQFRRYALPLKDALVRHQIVDVVQNDNSIAPFLRDVTDHLTQILETLDYANESLKNIQDLEQAEANNRLNNTMKLLTVISTIFIPLSFIAGVYGMNFKNMPETQTENGYFYVLGIMAVSMIGMLWYFKRKNWI